jgi:DHA1 family bicyclomycin/chloramphenicol resistance-like MFS transporter
MNMMLAEPETKAAPIMSERRVALLCALMVIMGPLSLALFTPAMPSLVEAFGSTEATVKMTLSIYFGGFAVAQLVCGPLSDGFGRRPVLMGFSALYAVASLLALLAPTIETLIAARFLQGVGAAAGIAISRALVRDLFTSEASARIMNLISILMGVCPALAPTLGGLSMTYLGWHSIFVIMFVAGVIIIVVVYLKLKETVQRDPSRIRPAALARSYGALLRSRYFITSALVLAGAMGAMYTQATLLPFILIDRVGLNPAQFGIGMLMQSGFFVLGSLTTKFLIARFSAFAIVPVGLCFMAVGACLTATILHIFDPTYLLVMVPIGIYTFGIPIVMPAMSTAGMAPFPHIAGSASALMGFLQMGSGLVGSMLGATFSDPVLALTIVVPACGLTSISSYLVWRRLPSPALASVVTTPKPG